MGAPARQHEPDDTCLAQLHDSRCTKLQFLEISIRFFTPLHLASISYSQPHQPSLQLITISLATVAVQLVLLAALYLAFIFRRTRNRVQQPASDPRPGGNKDLDRADPEQPGRQSPSKAAPPAASSNSNSAGDAPEVPHENDVSLPSESVSDEPDADDAASSRKIVE